MGHFWEKELAYELDKWFLVGFSVLLFIIHIGFFVWLYFAYSHVRNLKRQEREFLSKFRSNNEGGKNSEVTIKNYMARL